MPAGKLYTSELSLLLKKKKKELVSSIVLYWKHHLIYFGIYLVLGFL